MKFMTYDIPWLIAHLGIAENISHAKEMIEQCEIYLDNELISPSADAISYEISRGPVHGHARYGDHLQVTFKVDIDGIRIVEHKVYRTADHIKKNVEYAESVEQGVRGAITSIMRNVEDRRAAGENILAGLEHDRDKAERVIESLKRDLKYLEYMITNERKLVEKNNA
jgi:molecular chaperone DnaK (HSP70)